MIKLPQRSFGVADLLSSHIPMKNYQLVGGFNHLEK
jgi:hypothetical protein